MIELLGPTDPLELRAAKLVSQARLWIVDGIATDWSGSLVFLPSGVITTHTFFDQREGKTVTATQVDVAALTTSFVMPANGILYIASSSPPTTTSMNAVRLVNGARLPSRGLTIVSQNPVYVQGDYNTENPETGVVDSIHAPAAIYGDAITVLSNNWGPNGSDARGADPVTTRPATATTVNAAFAAGPASESFLGAGNGQIENVIRLLEDWSGQEFTYTGALVVLWHSVEATGAWRGPRSFYDEPIRIWSYDPLFDTTLPPGTP